MHRALISLLAATLLVSSSPVNGDNSFLEERRSLEMTSFAASAVDLKAKHKFIPCKVFRNSTIDAIYLGTSHRTPCTQLILQ